MLAYRSILLSEEDSVEKVSIPLLQEKDTLANSAGFLSQHSILISHLTLREAQMPPINPGPSQGCLCTQTPTHEPMKRKAKSAKGDGQGWNTGENPTGPLLPRPTEKDPEETSVEGETFDELNWLSFS